MNIPVIYSTTGCPKCHVLKQRFVSAGIPFADKNADDPVIHEQGFKSAPILEVDGTFYEFAEAIQVAKKIVDDFNSAKAEI